MGASQFAGGSGSRTTASVFAHPGCSAASPATSVPVLPGMPARSKSFRTQSAGESVSVPSGMREAPPGSEGAAVVRRVERHAAVGAGRPDAPSWTATESTMVTPATRRRASPSSFASRSSPSAPVKPRHEQQRDRPVLERVRGRARRARGRRRRRRRTRSTSSTDADGRRAGIALDLEHAVGARSVPGSTSSSTYSTSVPTVLAENSLITGTAGSTSSHAAVCEPSPSNVSCANPTHSAAGSNASVGSVSPTHTDARRGAACCRRSR